MAGILAEFVEDSDGSTAGVPTTKAGSTVVDDVTSTYPGRDLTRPSRTGQDRGGDQCIISHSLRTLETRGGLLIGRLRGGQAVYLHLTPEGVEKASEICTKL